MPVEGRGHALDAQDPERGGGATAVHCKGRACCQDLFRKNYGADPHCTGAGEDGIAVLHWMHGTGHRLCGSGVAREHRYRHRRHWRHPTSSALANQAASAIFGRGTAVHHTTCQTHVVSSTGIHSRVVHPGGAGGARAFAADRGAAMGIDSRGTSSNTKNSHKCINFYFLILECRLSKTRPETCDRS